MRRSVPPGRVDRPNPSSPDIQVGRFETFLRRLLSIKRAGLLTTVDSQFSVSTDPLSSDVDADQQLALGWRRYGTVSFAAGVAAQQLAFTIWNPVNSGVMLIVEVFQVKLAAVGTIQITVEDVPSLGIGGGVYTAYDSRLTRGNATGITTATAQIQIGTLAAGFPTGRSIYISPFPETFAELKQPYVMTPGQALVVTGGVVLVTGGVECVWRERAAEAAELAIQ